MRHLSRTHRVSVAWLREQYQRVSFVVDYVKSCDMVASIFTKSTPSLDGWSNARKKINVFGGASELEEVIMGAAGMSCFAVRDGWPCVPRAPLLR